MNNPVFWMDRDDHRNKRVDRQAKGINRQINRQKGKWGGLTDEHTDVVNSQPEHFDNQGPYS